MADKTNNKHLQKSFIKVKKKTYFKVMLHETIRNDDDF